MRNSLALITLSLLLTACQQPFSSSADIAVTTDTTNTSTEINSLASPKYQEFIDSGAQLPIASIKTIDGQLVDLASSKKQKLVILFATWCSDSNRLLKALNQEAILQNNNIEIIAIAREEDKATVMAWRDEHHIKVPLATDVDRSIFKQFAAAGIPRLVTVSESNKVIKMNLAEGQEQLSLIDWQG